MNKLLALVFSMLLAIMLAAGCATKTEDVSGTTGGTDSTPMKSPADDKDDAAGEDADEPGDKDAGDDKETVSNPPTNELAVYKNADGKLACPVMGVAIESEAAAVGHQDYKGKRYYFCCGDCPKIFAKNPDEWAK